MINPISDSRGDLKNVAYNKTPAVAVNKTGSHGYPGTR